MNFGRKQRRPRDWFVFECRTRNTMLCCILDIYGAPSLRSTMNQNLRLNFRLGACVLVLDDVEKVFEDWSVKTQDHVKRYYATSHSKTNALNKECTFFMLPKSILTPLLQVILTVMEVLDHLLRFFNYDLIVNIVNTMF